jgi:hypothetical protein
MDGGMTMSLNQVAHLQTEIAHAYMRRHHLSPSEFVDINRKYGILRFLELGYESFHLTGTQGVVDEVEQFVAEQQTSHSTEQYSDGSASQ